jgi:hypothetical protein
LQCFIPQEVIQAAPELEELWKNKAGEQIAPYMKKARETLLNTGVPQARIKTKVVDGSRDAASDILKEARAERYGTIVLGRRSLSGVKEFFMGSVTSKVRQDYAGMAVWVVQQWACVLSCSSSHCLYLDFVTADFTFLKLGYVINRCLCDFL